jgi:DNA-directed RNA polymerase subunit F
MTFTQALLEKKRRFQGTQPESSSCRFQVTGEFTATPDPKLNVDPQLGTAAFKLSAQEPNSDPIQVTDGFYIMHLAGIVEARPLTVEEAKPKIVDAIKRSRTRELMSTKGAGLVHQLRERDQVGPAARGRDSKNGAKAEKVPPFSLLDEAPEAQSKEEKKEPPELMAIKDAVAYLNPGEISDFLPSDESGLIAILEKREPSANANDVAKKAAFENRMLNNKRQIVFYDGCAIAQREARRSNLRKGRAL